MARVIGYVKSFENGTFFVKDVKGKIHQLKAGDAIHQGELVYGAPNNSSDAKIVIDVTLEGAGDLVIAGNGALKFDTSMLQGIFSHDDAVVYVNSVKDAIAQNEYRKEDGQKTAAGDETAAGESVVNTEQSGDTFSDRTANVQDVNTVVAASAEETEGTNGGTDPFRPVIVNTAPIANDDPVIQNLGLVVRGEIVSLGDGNVTTDAWTFTHNGGAFSIDVLTELSDAFRGGDDNSGNTYVDINANQTQEAFDSYIYLLDNSIDGTPSQRVIAYNDDDGHNTDGSVHSYDSYISLEDLPAGSYTLMISAFYLSPEELDSGVNGETDELYFGPYQLTFSGDLNVISGPSTDSGVILLNEDIPITIFASTLLANDTDADGDFLSIIGVSNPEGGSVALTNGNVIFTPDANYNGAASFEYTITDGRGGIDTARVSLNILPVNDAPTTTPVVLEPINEDNSRIITQDELLANVTDIDSTNFNVINLEISNGNGTLSNNENGTWTYTPASNDDTEVSFTYIIRDGSHEIVGSVSLDILPVNDAPTIEANTVASGTMSELSAEAELPGAELSSHGIIAFADVDVSDTHTLSFQANDERYLGTFTMGAIDPATKEVSWNFAVANEEVEFLAAGESITQSYTVSIDDGNGGSVDQVITLSVTGTNDQPIVSDINANGTENVIVDLTNTVSNVTTYNIGGHGQSFYPSEETLSEIGIKFTSNQHGSFRFDIFNEQGDMVYSSDAIIVNTGNSHEVVSVNLSLSGLNINEKYTIDFDAIEGDPRIIVETNAQDQSDGIGYMYGDGADNTYTYYRDNYDHAMKFTYDGQKAVYESHDTTDVVNMDDTQEDVVTTFDGNLATATDVDASDSHTYRLVENSEAASSENVRDLGVIVDPATGDYTLSGNFNALAAGETVTVTFQYVADDGHGFDGTDGINENSVSEPKTVTLSVTGTNDQPVVSEVSVSQAEVIEGINTFSGVLPSVSDSDVNDTHTYVINQNSVAASNPLVTGVSVTLVDAVTGAYSVEGDFNSLAEGETATVTFEYYAVDGSTTQANGESNTSESQTVTLTVTGTNDAPIVSDVTVADSATETNGLETIYTGTLALTSDLDTTDTHTFQQSGTASVVTSNGAVITDLAVTVAANGGYTVNGNFDALAMGETATVTFSYTATDDSGAPNAVSEAKTVTLTVTGTNDAPIAQAAVNALAEDTIINGSVVATDVDAGETATLSYALVNPAPTGLVFNADGSYTFDASSYDSLSMDEQLVLTIPYTARDVNNATSASANLVITVTGTNDAPTITAVNSSMDEDGTPVTVAFTTADVDGSIVSTTATVPEAQGSVVVNANGTYTFTPKLNFNGEATITLVTTDNNGATATTTSTVMVDPINDAPVANDDFSVIGLRGEYYGYVEGTDGANLSNIAQIRTFMSNNAPDALFTPTSLNYGLLSGNLGYGTNLQSFLGVDAASLSADPVSTGDAILHMTGSITLNAGSYNFRVTADDGYTILIDGVSVATRNLNQMPTQTTHTAFTVPSDGEHTFELIYWDQAGQYQLKVELQEGTSGYSVLNVANGTHSFETSEDTPLAFTPSMLLGNDTDVENDTLTVASVIDGSGGTVALDGNGNIIFTPNANYSGPAYFDYTVSDGNGGSDTARVYVSVMPINDAPVIILDGTIASGSVVELNETDEQIGAVVTAQGQIAFSDVDTSAGHTASVKANGSNYLGTLTLGSVSAGAVAWNFVVADVALESLSSGQVIHQSYTITISDGVGGTVKQTVNINILGTNDTPVANDDIVITNIVAGQNITIASSMLMNNDLDVDHLDSFSVISTENSFNGTVSGTETVVFKDTASFGVNAQIIAESTIYVGDSETNALNNDMAHAYEIGRGQFGQVSASDALSVADAALPSFKWTGRIDDTDGTPTITDKDFMKVYLFAGEKIILDIDGADSGKKTIGTDPDAVDMYLKFYDANGNLLAANDDAIATLGGTGSVKSGYHSNSLDSYLEYTVSVDGYYYIEATAWNNNSSGILDDDGNYQLWVSIDPTQSEYPTSFDYTIEDNSLAQDSAHVSVITVQDSILTGTASDEILLGSGENDTLDGNGGKDILSAGEGNDTLVYDAMDTLIDGGLGIDTLMISANSTIDFTGLVSKPITNIEVIDLGNNNVSDASTLKNISLQDVIDMTENSAIHELYILGDIADKVTVDTTALSKQVDSVTEMVNGNEHTFDVYTNAPDPTVILKVEQAITDTI